MKDRIANLKSGMVGYKMAWDRLKKEYGQTKEVVNAHMDEIINLIPVRGSNNTKVQEFYETLLCASNPRRRRKAARVCYYYT